MESAEYDLAPDFAALVAEARRLHVGPIEVRVARNEVGAMLVLVLDGAESGEAALLRKQLVAFRVARGIDAPFVIVTEGPTRFVSKDPTLRTHPSPEPPPEGAS